MAASVQSVRLVGSLESYWQIGRVGKYEYAKNKFRRNPKGGVTFYYRGKERNSMETVGCNVSRKK